MKYSLAFPLLVVLQSAVYMTSYTVIYGLYKLG